MRNFLRAAVWGGIFVWSTADAGTVCGHRVNFAASLEVDYGEVEIGRGLTPTGQLIELFVSPRHSFTVLVTTPVGFSCVVATGEAWDSVKEPANTLPLSPDRVP